MDNIQQQALEKVMRQLSTTANDVNRYIADAVAEHDKIAALQADAERLRAELTLEKQCFDSQGFEYDRLTADLAAMTAERDAMRERAEGAFGWAEMMFERLGSKGGNEAIRYSYSRWRDEKWRGPDASKEATP